MRYCLVGDNSCPLFFMRFGELADFILSHSYLLKSRKFRNVSVHRVKKVPAPMYFAPSVRICSLKEFVVKHKLYSL